MKVCIIGKGKGWEDAPYDELTWGITQLNLRRKVDRVIDMNDYSLWGELEEKEAKESRRIASLNGIEYIDLETYPLKEVIDRFQTDYFSNTVDYAIALALFEGFNDIHLYGVNMISGGEYAYQKPGVDFWCGYAKGLGAKITVHGQISSIMKTKDGLLYGYGFPQGVI